MAPTNHKSSDIRDVIPRIGQTASAIPAHVWFSVSAIFRYLGPSFAVLLFPAVGVLGVAWLRIAAAAAVFVPMTRPWKLIGEADWRERALLMAFGGCLAGMNCCFYLAINRLPMSLVAAIEFIGTIAIALYGLRSRRNILALTMTSAGVFTLINVQWLNNPLGLLWAFLNGTLFVIYILLGHKVARSGAGGGIERLGAAMFVAFLFVMPLGFLQALQAFSQPKLIAAGIGVGICSSVIPYICDQLAMSRLSRESFALLLALLPASAALVGAIVLAQIPSGRDFLGLALVICGVAIHRPAGA